MNSSLASGGMSILKKCVTRSTVRRSNNRLLKLKPSKSWHEIGETLDKRSYSKLNSTNLNRNTQESIKVNHDSIKKYSKSVDILQILRKPKINLQQDVAGGEGEKVNEVSAVKKDTNNYYNESQELSSENLSDDKLRIRLNYEKLNLNPAGTAKVGDELYKRFTSNLKHNKKKFSNQYNNNLDEVNSSKMKNLYQENLQMIYNKKQLLEMMNTDQEKYQLNRRKLRESEYLQKSPVIDVRDLLSNKEKQKSQLTAELQNNKELFSKKIEKDNRLFGYKTVNERRKHTGEFEQFKKKLERKFFRSLVFKEDTHKETNIETNRSGLLKRRHNFYNQDRSFNTYKSKSDKKMSTTHRNYNIKRSKSLDSFSNPSQPLFEKSADFFNKFQLKQVDGRRSDMTKYFMDHRANVENLSEKPLDIFYKFPASVPKLEHGNVLEPSEIVENAAAEKNIDTKKAKRILKFSNYDDIDYTVEEPQYVLCIKD